MLVVEAVEAGRAGKRLARPRVAVAREARMDRTMAPTPSPIPVAGTDPTNTASVLRISASEFCVPSSEFVIRLQSVSNKVYDVQATTNLLVAFTNVVTNLPATRANAAGYENPAHVRVRGETE
jgi:hypothetical protein